METKELKHIENLDKKCYQIACVVCPIKDICLNHNHMTIRKLVESYKAVKLPKKPRVVNFTVYYEEVVGGRTFKAHCTVSKLEGEAIARKFNKPTTTYVRVAYRGTNEVIYEGNDYEEFKKVVWIK